MSARPKPERLSVVHSYHLTLVRVTYKQCARASNATIQMSDKLPVDYTYLARNAKIEKEYVITLLKKLKVHHPLLYLPLPTGTETWRIDSGVWVKGHF